MVSDADAGRSGRCDARGPAWSRLETNLPESHRRLRVDNDHLGKILQPRRGHAHGTSGSSLTHQSGTRMDLAWVGVFSARPASAWRDLRVRATPAKLVGGTEAARLLKAKRGRGVIMLEIFAACRRASPPHFWRWLRHGHHRRDVLTSGWGTRTLSRPSPKP